MKSAHEIWTEKHSFHALSVKNKIVKTIVQLFANFTFHKLHTVCVSCCKWYKEFHWLVHVINIALCSNIVLSYADSSKM